MKGFNEWSEEEFLNYVEVHACTSRAGFSPEMVERLYALAGRDVAWEGPRPRIVQIEPEGVSLLCREARDRQVGSDSAL